MDLDITDSPRWALIANALLSKIVVECDMEELPWNGGKFDIDRFIEIYKVGSRVIKDGQ